MLKLSKDTIEFIDRICEDSVNNPPVIVEFGDDHIAEIADFIAGAVIDNTDLEYITELLQRITSINFKMTRELITEVAQCKNQGINHEARLVPLEKPKGEKYGYY